MSKKRKQNIYAPDMLDQALSANNPVPMLTPVCAVKLFSDLCALLRRYIVMSERDAVAMTLWIIHTYCFRLFARSPLLLINAPERACGKSVALGLVAKLVLRPLECTNITVAGMFRVVQNREPTILIDEADTFLEGKSELAGVLNRGYERGGFVLRVEKVGDDFKEVGYQVFGPKALAGIALERHLPDPTMSRGIQISMRRKVKGEVVERLRNIDPNLLSDLRSRINRFVLDHKEQLEKGFENLPEELNDREQDNWEPLFAIASCIGPECIGMARDASLAIKAETPEPQSVSNNLLGDLRELLQDYELPYVTSARLVEMLTEDPDMGWADYNRGRPITARQLAKNLLPYQIRPRTVRMSPTSTPKGYEVAELKAVFGRYLQPLALPEEGGELPITKTDVPVSSCMARLDALIESGGAELPPLDAANDGSSGSVCVKF